MNNSSDPFINDRKTDKFIACEHELCCEEYHIAISCLLILGCQLVGVLISSVLKYEKIKYCSGGATFFLLALVNLLTSQTFYPRQIMVTCLVCIWALRLSVYLMFRAYSVEFSHKISIAFADDLEPVHPSTPEHHKLQRVVFWMVQIIWISVVGLPAVLVFLIAQIHCQPFQAVPGISLRSSPLSDTDIVGLTLWIIGFLCEFFADLQKYRFKQDSDNGDGFCTKDLWTWSRHPNYFGEIIQWWGIFTIYSETIQVPWMWVGIISPLFITSLLLFLQVPALEQHSDVRFGSTTEYQGYKQCTSPIIPMPPELYVEIPDFIKKLFLFELPFYDHIPDDAKPKEPQKTLPRSSRRDMDMPF